VRALALVVEYAVWLRSPDSKPADPGDVQPAVARQFVQRVLVERPEEVELDREQVTELLATYDIDVWPAVPVATLREANAAAKRLGWDVVLKATRESVRERPDAQHVWRNIDGTTEMKEAWATLNGMVPEPADAAFVVQRNAPAGVPISIRSFEDPLFGPVVSFGISGPIVELLGDWAYRIPPLQEHDVAGMVREVKSSPLLFGYRGAEPVDVESIERLITKVAHLQNDLPEVSALQLSLALAGVNGATVLTASVRLAPVRDPRPDSLVRRLPDATVTLPG